MDLWLKLQVAVQVRGWEMIEWFRDHTEVE